MALAEVERMAAKAGQNQHPIEHLLGALHRAAQLVLVWGTMAAAIDDLAEREAEQRGTHRGDLTYYEAGEDERGVLRVAATDRLLTLNSQALASIHPYQVQYERALDRHARIAKLCLDAGVEERRIQLQEDQVALAHDAFEAMLDDLKLSAKQRQEARHAYARRLRQPGELQHGTRRRTRPARANHRG